VSDPAQDPFVRQLRQQISDNDRALVAAINKRLDLVARLKAYARTAAPSRRRA
jgi:chorismate mutase